MLTAPGARPGERVIHLGVGPGLLATSIASRVGVEGAVLGVDV